MSSSALTICVDRSSGRIEASDPLSARPIGLRAVATMTASGMRARYRRTPWRDGSPAPSSRRSYTAPDAVGGAGRGGRGRSSGAPWRVAPELGPPRRPRLVGRRRRLPPRRRRHVQPGRGQLGPAALHRPAGCAGRFDLDVDGAGAPDRGSRTQCRGRSGACGRHDDDRGPPRGARSVGHDGTSGTTPRRRPRRRPPGALGGADHPGPGRSATAVGADRSRPPPPATSARPSGAPRAPRRRALDAFFPERMGPVIGHDYQHVYPLGGDRWLWLFQDTFVDYGGTATASTRRRSCTTRRWCSTARASRCSTAARRGPRRRSSRAPASGALASGSGRWAARPRQRAAGVLGGDGEDVGPAVPDGLGWVPTRTWLATYDSTTLARLDLPAGAGRRGGTDLRLRRRQRRRPHVPLRQHVRAEPRARGRLPRLPVLGHLDVAGPRARGQLDAAPEYRTGDGWSADPGAARPILSGTTPRTRCSRASSPGSGSP